MVGMDMQRTKVEEERQLNSRKSGKRKLYINNVYDWGNIIKQNEFLFVILIAKLWNCYCQSNTAIVEM